MILDLIRFSSGKEDTLGVLFIDNKFACFTLEDEHRTNKIWGETRIPAGRYKIELRTFGDFHRRYSARFPDLHNGMLWLRNVPNFESILIHIGNDDDDTAGCILVGSNPTLNIRKSGWISSSTTTYKNIYPVIAEAIATGDEVWINIQDPK